MGAQRGVRIGTGSVAPSPSLEPHVPTLDNLEEIAGWLGTFRERLRQARNDERTGVAAVAGELEARYQFRRAELS
jgi:hypothetical protein